MKNFSKKFISIGILLVFSLLGISKLNAQDSKLEIKIETVSVSSHGSDDGKIKVHLTGGNPEFIYRLYDSAPWDGGNEITRSEPTFEIEYTFNNLKPGKYMVCVTDNTQVTKCEYITVKEE